MQGFRPPPAPGRTGDQRAHRQLALQRDRRRSRRAGDSALGGPLIAFARRRGNSRYPLRPSCPGLARWRHFDQVALQSGRHRRRRDALWSSSVRIRVTGDGMLRAHPRRRRFRPAPAMTGRPGLLRAVPSAIRPPRVSSAGTSSSASIALESRAPAWRDLLASTGARNARRDPRRPLRRGPRRRTVRLARGARRDARASSRPEERRARRALGLRPAEPRRHPLARPTRFDPTSAKSSATETACRSPSTPSRRPSPVRPRRSRTLLLGEALHLHALQPVDVDLHEALATGAASRGARSGSAVPGAGATCPRRARSREEPSSTFTARSGRTKFLRRLACPRRARRRCGAREVGDHRDAPRSSRISSTAMISGSGGGVAQGTVDRPLSVIARVYLALRKIAFFTTAISSALGGVTVWAVTSEDCLACARPRRRPRGSTRGNFAGSARRPDRVRAFWRQRIDNRASGSTAPARRRAPPAPCTTRVSTHRAGDVELVERAGTSRNSA